MPHPSRLFAKSGGRIDSRLVVGSNVTQIIKQLVYPDPGEPLQVITQFHYARNGRAVTFVAGWTKSTSGVYDVTYLREFRYDGARQRYLNRKYNADAYELDETLDPLSETWSDYDGDTIYGDYVMVEDPESPGDWVDEDRRSYAPGIGTFAWTSGVPDMTTLKHYHTDMIGTTRMMTNSGGTGTEPAAFTAFGERIAGSAQRYGYAGAHGYQTASSDDPLDAYAAGFKFLHVGARYYDPATGRFLQRDPIGIYGGLNVYAYVANAPTIAVDPDGLIWGWVAGAAARGAVWFGRKAVVPAAKWVAKKTVVPAARWAGRKVTSCAIRIAIRLARPNPRYVPRPPIYPPKPPLPPLRIPPNHPRIPPPNPSLN